ncbi:MAG: outer membrane protein assembly factor BamD [Flavobacteriales bacterium]
MSPSMRYLLLLLAFPLVFWSCSEYNKVLKSNDPDLKYAKAVEYFDEGECFKSLPLLEELLTVVKGTQRAENVYYYYAKVHYCVQDYYLANYYFKTFTKTFSSSPRAEECLFLAAMCNYNLSPKYSLDQQDTKAAIDEFQLFLDRYPTSDRKDTCNTLMADLRYKLEVKSYKLAKLYAKTQKYLAASLALEDFVYSYPASQYGEEAMFLIVESRFNYAENSIEGKKLERFEETIKSYTNFVNRFPESQKLKDAEEYYLGAVSEMEELRSINP